VINKDPEYTPELVLNGRHINSFTLISYAKQYGIERGFSEIEIKTLLERMVSCNTLHEVVYVFKRKFKINVLITFDIN